jgi:hypothetical protein
MPRIEKLTILRIHDVDAERFLHTLLMQHRAGVLTLHIGRGKVATVEWKEAIGNGAGELGPANHVPETQEALLD